MIDLNDYEPSEEDIFNPVWWKVNCPEGTTHYLPEQPWVARSFIKEDGDILYYSYGQGYKWAHWGVKRMKSCYKLIERPKECKGMKGSDKVMIELTGYQVAMIYTIIAKSEVNDKAQSFNLFGLLSEYLGGIKASDLPQHKDFPHYIPFNLVSEDVYKAVLEPETPVLTDAQKKAIELKQTIAKAQKQLEELEKNL